MKKPDPYRLGLCRAIFQSHLVLALIFAGLASEAKVITVTTANNSNLPAGETNLVLAISLLADGDTIQFAIPGSGVHYINTPYNGYPLITKNNITIDGYSQPGSSANSASIHSTNHAQLAICLTSTNGNALSMYSAVTNFAGIDYPNLGFGDSEQAVLGFFRATNVWIKGIAFLAAPATSTSQSPDPSQNTCKTICFAVDAPDVSNLACQGWHVSGCWFGVEPTTRQVAYMDDGVTVATPGICIATYSTGTNGTPGFPNIETQPGPGTIGVAAGSANPRAEFNVIVTGYGLDSQGGGFRISGNFWGVLPDGTTLADISTLNGGSQQGDAFAEFGSSHDILIGTDGDGINDADEGNVFGAYANGGVVLYYYGSQANTVIAGNTVGVDIHGNSFGVGQFGTSQITKFVHHFSTSSQVRFGSDFNGVSDALEANTVVNSVLFDCDTGSTTNTHWISARGNSLVNTGTPDYSTPPIGDGQSSNDGSDLYTNFIDVSGATGTAAIIPVIGAGTTTAFLIGTCGKPLGAPFTRVIVDLYAADTTPLALPQGKQWLAGFTDNSAADLDPAAGSFKFALPSGLVKSGTMVTIAVTYSSDTQPVLGSVQRAGNQTTLTVSGGTGPIYDIMQSPVVTGPYTNMAVQRLGSTTFTDNATPKSFYRAVGGSATGQTSPFSALFTMP